MHLVQLLASLSLGGSELVAVEISEHAVAAGHRVTVIAGDGVLGGRLRHSGAEHLDWPVGKKRPACLACVPRLTHWLAREQPDLLHAHSRLPAWVARLSLRQRPADTRPAFVTSVHGHYSVNPYSAVMTAGDRVIAVSGSIRDYVHRHYPAVDPARVTTIPGGIDPQAFPRGYRPSQAWLQAACSEFPELGGRRWLCLPGRLSRYKGHPEFFELLARLVAEEDGLQGVIVGRTRPGSAYQDQLLKLAQRRGLSGRVTFTGERLDVRDWMAASEIVYNLCADPPEAFGRTVPEALSLGVPVIGWGHGGVGETLALLFPEGAVTPGDREALYRRSLRFLRNRPQVPTSNAFGLPESMAGTFALYEQLLGARTV